MTQAAADKAAIVLLGLAAAGWYIAGRAAADATAGDARAPGRRAIGFALPVGFCVLVAIWVGRPEIAIGALFATAVAAVTLVLGVSIIVAPYDYSLTGRRTWAFVLPVALIALLIGFSGTIGWMHIAFLALEGLALVLLWNEPGDATIADVLPAEKPTASRLGARIGSTLELIVAGVAAAVAGWIGVTAAEGISNNLQLPGAGLVTALMLAPALVLPMLGICSTMSATGRLEEAVGSVVAFVLISLCALLPLTGALWLTRPMWHPPLAGWVDARLARGNTPSTLPATAPATTASTGPATTRASIDAPADESNSHVRLIYPMAVWRVDTVLLIAAGLLLLPVTLGRWRLERAEGLGLIIGYTLYMVLTTVAAR